MAELTKPKQWKDFSDEKKKEIQSIYSRIEELVKFSNKANHNLFVYLYGEQVGSHLWSKFREFDNIIKFFNYLDVENRTVILSNIYGGERYKWGEENPLYAHCNK